MWQVLLGPITGVIQKWQEGRQAKRDAKATIDTILAEASAADATVAGQIALVRTKNENNSWKDEYALIVISGPFVIGMILGLFEGLGFIAPGTTSTVIGAMFVPLGDIPEWWSSTFKAGMLAALGITLWNKTQKMI